MRRTLLMAAAIIGLFSWQCSRISSDISLKSSLEESAAKINTAMTAISESGGYDLMIMNDLSKSGDGFRDSITLNLISGIYDFRPDTFVCRHFSLPYWHFDKSDESEMLILNMPHRLVYHPRYLFNPIPPDTVAENDFTITASDYHYYYSFIHRYDYKLTAGFTLKGEDLGMLDVVSAGETFAGRSYSSEYSFPDDYSLMVSFERGDTSVSSMALMQDDEILLAEESYHIWSDFRKKERKYILTVGDVKIVRGSSVDSIQVFLDGVLQKSAGAVITDDDDSDGSVCHRRDILLTFDDGTTEKLSDLIGPSLEILRTLVDPMREMYFARRIVDHLAMTIYYQER
jgi:archaellum component FlaG (FlaF/FlaG flagellin family)